ncbi:MAG TPA: HAD family hydrolase [Bacteroidales bacterium]|nr:HAD family hydrolase [Bacteroidales bacterium]
MKKALFLDRDGVINLEKNYVHTIEDFEFNEGIFDLCRKFQNEGYLIIVITNQAGIGRKLYDESDFGKLTKWMTDQFRRNGIMISKVYHCPHHPEFTGKCNCRKPEPGMIFKAAAEFNLEIPKCVLIGDNKSDIQAGYNAGMQKCFYYKDFSLTLSF